MHDDSPVPAKDPVGHAAQATLLSVVKRPVVHAVHDVVVAKLPAPHTEQTDCCADAVKRPAAHAVQDETGPSLNVPARHAVQSVEDAALQKPLPHKVQNAVPVPV